MGPRDPTGDDGERKSRVRALEALSREVEGIGSLQLFFAPWPQIQKVLRVFRELIAASEDIDGSQRAPLLEKWLRMGRQLPNTGNKHGVVVRASLSDDPKSQFLLKHPQEDAQSVLIEHWVQSKVNNLRRYVPNFPLSFGMFNCTRGKRGKPCAPPGDRKPGPLTTFLLMELVPDASSAKSFAMSARSVRPVVDLIVQVLLALEVAQRALQFTHYDLHPGNVLVSPLVSAKPVVLVYHVDAERAEGYAVSAPLLAAVIDHGTSHVSGIPEEYKKMRKWAGFHIKSWGQISDRFHPAHDMMRFVDGMMFYLNERNPDIARTDGRGLERLTSMWEGVRSDFPAFSSEDGRGLRPGGLLAGSQVEVGRRFKSPRDVVDALKSHGLYQAPAVDARVDARHVGFV